MPRFSRIASTIRTLFKRRRNEQELADELQFHIDQHAEHLTALGIPAAEAYRQARAALGTGVAQHQEQQRTIAGLRWLDEFWGDIRFGMRGLWRNKSFAAIAILSMALGIGAATAMFSVVYAILLDVYPYADSARTVNPIVHDPGVPDDWNWFVLNPAEYEAYRHAGPFEDVFGMTTFGFQLDEDGLQQPIRAVILTKSANNFNRVPAYLGRSLQESDGDWKEPTTNAIVLGYKFWQTHYNADPNVIGQPFHIGKAVLRIVGVMPRRYTLGSAPEIYMPLSALSTVVPDLQSFGLIAFAKLKPGMSAEAASQVVDPMLHDFAKQTPNFFPKEFHARLQPLLDGFTTRSKVLRNFPLLYLAVGGLLLIGCANCSLLLLARGTVRVHEFALRSAVGASRVRIVRQLLVESLLISLLGSILGTGLAYLLARIPFDLASDLFPTEATIRINLPVLGFSIAAALFAGLLFGLLPALRSSRTNLNAVLQRSNGRTSKGAGKRGLQWLIGAQLALTLVLLTIAGAAAAGLRQIIHMQLGFNPGNNLLLDIAPADPVIKTWSGRVAHFEAIQQSLLRVPGVQQVSIAHGNPPHDGGSWPVELLGDTAQQPRESRLNGVSANYFNALHIPLLQGRIWTAEEEHQGLPLAVVNAAFARHFSQDRSIIGRILRIPGFTSKAPPQMAPLASPAFQHQQMQIIGVVTDTVNDGLDRPTLPALYFNNNAWLEIYQVEVVSTLGDPQQYRNAIITAAHHATGKAWIQAFPYTLREQVEHDPIWISQRLIAVLLNIFAGFAMCLALVGLYSVVSYAVAQRTPEFGIRLALGAQRAQILALVLRSTVPTIATGLAVGLLASIAVRTRFGEWSQYSSRSSLLIAAAALLLTAAAILASLIPARRAASIEPGSALRAE